MLAHTALPQDLLEVTVGLRLGDWRLGLPSNLCMYIVWDIVWDIDNGKTKVPPCDNTTK